MKTNSASSLIAALILAAAIFICANAVSPKSSPEVTVVGKTASIPEGSTLVLYYNSRLYFISSVGDEVVVSIKTSASTYNVSDSGEITKVPLVGFETIDVKKTKTGIDVTWPWYMIKK